MTVVDLSERRPPAEQWPASAEERRAAAVEYARAELADGRSPTGADLQRRCGVSERTGRRIMKELTSATTTTGHADRPPGRPTANGQAATSGHGHDRSAATGHGQTATVAGQRPPANGQSDRSPATGRVAGQPSARPATIRPDRQPATASPTAGRAPTTTAEPAGKLARAKAWLDGHTDRLITWAVAAAAAVLSSNHMYVVALLAGEPQQLAWLWPVTADGFIVAALRQGSRWWLALGLAVSVSSNVLTHYPQLVETGIVSAGITAWPPVALLGTHCLLHSRKKEGIA